MAMASIASCAHTSRCQFAASGSFSGRRRSAGAGPISTKIKFVSEFSAPGPAGSGRSGRRGLAVVGSVVGAVLVAGAAAVAAAAASRAMAASGGGREAAILATRRGMRLFAQGDVKGSVLEFDKALELDPQQRPCAICGSEAFLSTT